MRLYRGQRGSHLPLRRAGNILSGGNAARFFAKGQKVKVAGKPYANKADLVRALAQNLGVPEKTARRVIDQFEKTLSQLIAEHGGINWKGVMNIFRYLRPGRVYRQPLTGEQLVKPDEEVIRVKMADKFGVRTPANQKK